MRFIPASKRRWFRLVLTAVVLVLVSVGIVLSGIWVNIAALLYFDRWINPQLIATACGNQVPFSFSTVHRLGEKEYDATFAFPNRDPEVSASVTIVLAPAGRYLKRSDYERQRSATIKTDRQKPPEMRWASDLFPDIGLRAQVGMVLGPGGGGGRTTFTTTDGRFDIRVTQSNRQKEGVTAPDLDTDKLARMISHRYDRGA